ncbi:uncharacterized protein LOC111642485 [Centruroides sculpturatus]|uniref:uncharacterized protein LOC111642485 n=1 Tax=Centruroides sculpturatus TaxID=218467 RepID=UPI000C6E2EB1|nr:uncharacterized protein LOC111642485 [Centruroides sculpturatus]
MNKNDSWEYISRKRKKPEIILGDESTMMVAEQWDTVDLKAMCDIILAISPAELKQTKGCETAHKIWNKLHEIFELKGPARKANLLKKLIFKKMREGRRQHGRSPNEGRENHKWCIDSGAPSHMCNDKARFSNVEASHVSELNLADSPTMEIKGSGDVIIKTKGGFQAKLENTLLAPKLRTHSPVSRDDN